jgi:hypothetical protein
MPLSATLSIAARHVSTSGSGHVGAIRFGPERWTILSENTRVRDNHNPAVPERSRRIRGLGRPSAVFAWAPAAKMRNGELVIRAESLLADPVGALPHCPVWDGNRGSGVERRVAASGLRLSLTLGDVRPSTPGFLESAQGRCADPGRRAGCTGEKGSGLMAHHEPT